MRETHQPAIQRRVDEILNRWPAVGFAFGVVRNGSLEFFSAHGVADIASGTPVTEDTVFRIASITKTCARTSWFPGIAGGGRRRCAIC